MYSMKYIAYISILIWSILSGCATHRLGRSGQQKVADQVWVVTGSSSGLGRGIALEAGRYRAKVALAARNTAELEKVAAEIRAAGGEAIVVTTDISDSLALKALAEKTIAAWGHIDVWVNNAGVTVLGNFWETPIAEHSRVMDVNIKGTFYGSYYAMQQFRRQGHGKLINIASAESRLPTAYQSSYAATKAGVKNMGIVLRQELRLAGMKNIKVVSVDPWALNTPIWDHAANHTGHAPRMGLMDNTSKAVNAVMHAAAGGRNRDMAVGWKTHAAYAVHWLMPRFSHRVSSNIVYRHQMKLAPPAADTQGNLFTPSAHPAVTTDIKERMKAEKKAYKRGKRARSSR